ncbi:hypothetical protein H4219_004619 [Mycoemilia scoparia]|uniref:Uncharacterized protein n=1 Tax=Mycoemilia scoparia TaxID=417184 RepID=A0A9W7ZR18_9FUNG|nr:hypothetical protein H4219_004619 [Mycoemilia scoparia]
MDARSYTKKYQLEQEHKFESIGTTGNNKSGKEGNRRYPQKLTENIKTQIAKEIARDLNNGKYVKDLEGVKKNRKPLGRVNDGGSEFLYIKKMEISFNSWRKRIERATRFADLVDFLRQGDLNTLEEAVELLKCLQHCMYHYNNRRNGGGEKRDKRPHGGNSKNKNLNPESGVTVGGMDTRVNTIYKKYLEFYAQAGYSSSISDIESGYVDGRFGFRRSMKSVSGGTHGAVSELVRINLKTISDVIKVTKDILVNSTAATITEVNTTTPNTTDSGGGNPYIDNQNFIFISNIYKKAPEWMRSINPLETDNAGDGERGIGGRRQQYSLQETVCSLQLAFGYLVILATIKAEQPKRGKSNNNTNNYVSTSYAK